MLNFTKTGSGTKILTERDFKTHGVSEKIS